MLVVVRGQTLGRDSGAQHCLPHSSQGLRLHVYAWSFQNLFCPSKIFSLFTLQPYLKNFGQTHITTLKLGPNEAGFITAQKTYVCLHIAFRNKPPLENQEGGETEEWRATPDGLSYRRHWGSGIHFTGNMP